MPSGTNEAIKLRKLERLVRRAFQGLDAMLYVLLAQTYRGGCGHIAVGTSLTRDILTTLDDIDEIRAAAAYRRTGDSHD